MLNIKKNEPLSKYVTFHVGGKAKFFVIAKMVEELKEALEWAKKDGQKYFIIGGGSNLLFGDDGYDGLVIKLAINDIDFEDEFVMAGAGTPLALVVMKSAGHGYDMSAFAGIPGTLGGAVCGNAGAYGNDISKILEHAEILHPNGKVEVVDNSWFKFGYRNSKMKYWFDKDRPIVLRAWLKLEKGDPENLKSKIKEIIMARNAKTPKGFSAGSAFKNIKGDVVLELLEKHGFSNDEKEKFRKFKAIPAAWFIEHAGLKGKRMGGAFVAEEHGNYIMNDGTGKAEDIVMLLSFIKQQVRDKFGVQLEEEIQIIV